MIRALVLAALMLVASAAHAGTATITCGSSGATWTCSVCSCTWTSPAGVSVVRIEAWGGGGGGAPGSGTNGGGGGGGGAYAREDAEAITPSTAYDVIPANESACGNGGDASTFCEVSCAAVYVEALGGAAASTSTGGVGGDAALCTGSTRNSGGAGGNGGTSGSTRKGGGGGGGAGDTNAGQNGVADAFGAGGTVGGGNGAAGGNGNSVAGGNGNTQGGGGGGHGKSLTSCSDATGAAGKVVLTWTDPSGGPRKGSLGSLGAGK